VSDDFNKNSSRKLARLTALKDGVLKKVCLVWEVGGKAGALLPARKVSDHQIGERI